MSVRIVAANGRRLLSGHFPPIVAACNKLRNYARYVHTDVSYVLRQCMPVNKYCFCFADGLAGWFAIQVLLNTNSVCIFARSHTGAQMHLCGAAGHWQCATLENESMVAGNDHVFQRIEMMRYAWRSCTLFSAVAAKTIKGYIRYLCKVWYCYASDGDWDWAIIVCMYLQRIWLPYIRRV